MEPQYIYLKSANLDDENKFKIELTKDNNVKEVKISKNQNHLWTNLKISPRIGKHTTEWNDYKRIKKLSDFILQKRKMKLDV